LLPTVTVIVAVFAISGQKCRSEAILTNDKIKRRVDVLIALTVELKQAVAARNTGKVTELLLSYFFWNPMRPVGGESKSKTKRLTAL